MTMLLPILLALSVTSPTESDSEKFLRLISTLPNVSISTPAPTPTKSALYHSLGAAVVASAITDVVSTELLINQGGYELNPLAQSTPARIIGKSAATLIVLWASNKLHQHNHPRIATILRLAASSTWTAASIHNFNQLR